MRLNAVVVMTMKSTNHQRSNRIIKLFYSINALCQSFPFDSVHYFANFIIDDEFVCVCCPTQKTCRRVCEGCIWFSYMSKPSRFKLSHNNHQNDSIAHTFILMYDVKLQLLSPIKFRMKHVCHSLYKLSWYI